MWAGDPGFLPDALAAGFASQELSGKVAVFAIAATAVGIAALMASILVLHVHASAKGRRVERLRSEWVALLLDPDAHPSRLVVEARDLEAFMVVWGQILQSVRGDYRDSLVAVLRRSGVPELARRRLKRGSLRERLLCASVLGSLPDEVSRPTLADLALGKEPFLSLAAATAMVHIHPRESVEMLLPHMVARRDWPLSRVHAALSEGDPAMVSNEIVGYVMASMPDVPLRAIRLMALVRQESRSMLIRTLMLFQTDMPWESEAALLDEIQDPLLGDLVRDRLSHREWRVVVAALKAIARIGDAEDVMLVHPLLDHPQWWVRYRAAKAIASLPGIKPIEIELMASRHADPYARDMLRFALSEQSLS